MFVGSESYCFHNREGWAVIHACKSPCHQSAVGYRGNLPKAHPNYLILKKPDNLYLNIIDPQRPLFMPQLFIEFLSFSREKWEAGQNILIHCNKGESRAPSLGLLFLAKIAGTISNDSYETARNSYTQIDRLYDPGEGIKIYLSSEWHKF